MAILPKSLITPKGKQDPIEFPPLHIQGDSKKAKENSGKGRSTENNQAAENKKGAESKAKLTNIEQKKEGSPIKGRSGVWGFERKPLDLSSPQKKELLVTRDKDFPEVTTVEDLIAAKAAKAAKAAAKATPQSEKGVTGHKKHK